MHCTGWNALQCEKPPLGLTPRCVVDELRARDILDAMNRFIAANKPIPIEWVEEYNEIISRKDKQK